MKRDLNKALGKVLKELRENKRMSQQELGDYADVDRSFISRIERGIGTPSVAVVFKICALLEIKPSEFLARVENQVR
ncbi:MAG: helix-turn-helix transcriptional regulator [Bacteroidetes bacterium]|nr:helix-turn-helix transcriptional regulator [Bacteroidota bacterium]